MKFKIGDSVTVKQNECNLLSGEKVMITGVVKDYGYRVNHINDAIFLDEDFIESDLCTMGSPVADITIGTNDSFTLNVKGDGKTISLTVWVSAIHKDVKGKYNVMLSNITHNL